MAEFQLKTFDDGLIELAEEAVEALEQLERSRRDERTTLLLASGRKFLADVLVYFDVRGSR
jgi:hypothetical protein